MDFQVVIYPKISKTDPNFLFKKVRNIQKGFSEILSKRWELGV